MAKSFINDIFEKLAQESARLARYNKKPTITSREIRTLVARLVLLIELAKHAVSEGTKAVTKFTSSGRCLFRYTSAFLSFAHYSTDRVVMEFRAYDCVVDYQLGNSNIQVLPHSSFLEWMEWIDEGAEQVNYASMLAAKLADIKLLLEERNPPGALYELEQNLQAEYSELQKEQELLWALKALQTHLQDADLNTKYFHTTITRWRHTTYVARLHGPDGLGLQRENKLVRSF
ncbi:hypothetical protein IFM89_004756 [Coptis chinensis]|uniref:Histone H2B n=1 Tax=Coptis chinensis TaxID=261450 RepID=A0A835LM89_9MAGN|nr:hypothetical protein IFM89_004756 [Coptis chinensis]